MGLKPIRRTKISDQVCEQMQQMILDGAWKPGQKIPSESELAEQFGISRMSVREAISKMSAIGLLESRFSEGNYVKEIGAEVCINAILPAAYINDNTISEVLEFRSVMEAKTAGIAARRAGPDDVRELEECLREMEGAAGDLEAFARADLDFHIKLACITRNSLLAACMHMVRDVLGRHMERLVDRRGYESGIRDHRKIAEAVRNHDEEGASALMEEHIKDICETFRDVEGGGEGQGRA